MPRSSKLSALKRSLLKVPLPVVKPSLQDPRLTARIVIGLLLLANIAAALFAFRPWADSQASLETQLASLRKQQVQTKARIEQLKALVKKSEQARKEGDQFLAKYFIGRRTAASTLVGELTRMAKSSGIKPKEHSFAFEQVEGSDTMAMMTITANYEGSYADLVQYANKLDRSEYFFIVESLAASPQQGAQGLLNVGLKVNVFVRDDSGQPIKLASADQKAGQP
ncbi:MAG: hypothetical protein HYZ37_11790 [Candidatus Solibacter usitatus]|nr:hypothetical protein [Candidatus Solibacter usitatus]